MNDAPIPDPTQTRQVQEFKQPNPLLGGRIDPSGRFVFAGAQDNTIQRWELAGGKKTALAGHQSWVRGLAFLSQEKRLVSGDYQGRLIWWDAEAETPTPLRTFEAHDGWVRAVAVSPDGKLVATCGNDRLVKLWASDNGKPVRALAGHATHVYNVAFHPDGKQLASVDHRGVVKHWDLAKGTVERDLDAGVLSKYDATFRAHIGGARGVSFNADGTRFACAGITNVSNAYAGIGNPVIVLFDWTSGKRLALLKPKEAFQGTMWGVGFHPAGFWIGVGGGSGGALWFWRADQAASIHAVTLPANARDVHLHPDGRRLAVACFDGAVRVYDIGGDAPR